MTARGCPAAPRRQRPRRRGHDRPAKGRRGPFDSAQVWMTAVTPQQVEYFAGQAARAPGRPRAAGGVSASSHCGGPARAVREYTATPPPGRGRRRAATWLSNFSVSARIRPARVVRISLGPQPAHACAVSRGRPFGTREKLSLPLSMSALWRGRGRNRGGARGYGAGRASVCARPGWLLSLRAARRRRRRRVPATRQVRMRAARKHAPPARGRAHSSTSVVVVVIGGGGRALGMARKRRTRTRTSRRPTRPSRAATDPDLVACHCGTQRHATAKSGTLTSRRHENARGAWRLLPPAHRHAHARRRPGRVLR